MRADWRDNRRQELLDIRNASPATLIALYRRTHLLEDLVPLPAVMTFEAMIEAILDKEGIERFSDDDAKNN